MEDFTACFSQSDDYSVRIPLSEKDSAVSEIASLILKRFPKEITESDDLLDYDGLFLYFNQEDYYSLGWVIKGGSVGELLKYYPNENTIEIPTPHSFNKDLLVFNDTLEEWGTIEEFLYENRGLYKKLHDKECAIIASFVNSINNLLLQ